MKNLKPSDAKPPIDTSEFPVVPEENWQMARRYGGGGRTRPVKERISIRLDADIIALFKDLSPKGYQTEMNRALRMHALKMMKEKLEEEERGEQA